jgi:hypothetical protein
MKLRSNLSKCASLVAIGGLLAIPLAAVGQDHHGGPQHSGPTRGHGRPGRGPDIHNHRYNPPVVIVYQHDWRYRHHSADNDWRNLAFAGGFIGILGLLEQDDTLFFAGTAGALYAVYRLDEDRRSDDRHLRARAFFFSRPDFWRDGRHYVRRTTWRGGREYYQFCLD